MNSIILAIVLHQIHMHVVEYILDDQTINSSKCGVVSLVFTNCRSFKGLWLVNGIIMAIVLRQIHVQAVEYILDAQTILASVW